MQDRSTYCTLSDLLERRSKCGCADFGFWDLDFISISATLRRICIASSFLQCPPNSHRRDRCEITSEDRHAGLGTLRVSVPLIVMNPPPGKAYAMQVITIGLFRFPGPVRSALQVERFCLGECEVGGVGADVRWFLDGQLHTGSQYM